MLGFVGDGDNNGDNNAQQDSQVNLEKDKQNPNYYFQNNEK